MSCPVMPYGGPPRFCPRFNRVPKRYGAAPLAQILTQTHYSYVSGGALGPAETLAARSLQVAETTIRFSINSGVAKSNVFAHVN
jgi:hypothetical protein